MRKLFMICILCLVVTAQTFPDVPAGHWALSGIEELVELGIVVGFPDGSFRGDTPITRYESALMMSRLFDLSGLDAIGELRDDVAGLQDTVDEMRKGQNVHLALGLVDEAFDRLDALESKLSSVTAAQPTTLTLFDTIQDNLKQLEAGFTNGLLATQQNVLTEVELQLQELETALQASITATVEARLQASDRRLAGALDELRGVDAETTEALDELSTEVDDLRAQLEETASTPDWIIGINAGAGGRGDGVVANADVGFASGQASAQLGYEKEGDSRERFGLEARYNVTPEVAAFAQYKSTVVGKFSSLGLDAVVLAPIGIKASVGHGIGIEAGTQIYHDGDRRDSVVPGLDLSATVRAGFEEERTALLYDIQAGLELPLGKFELTPTVLYRRVDLDDGSGYAGFVGGVSLDYSITDDLDIYGAGRYGLFSPLDDGPARNVPEGELGLRYEDVNFEVFLDSSLPEFGSPDFNDTNPLGRPGLQLGVRLGIDINLAGRF